MFTKAPIFILFNLERYIRIEIDAFSYAIDSILNQLTFNSGQWNLVAYFSQKIISAKT